MGNINNCCCGKRKEEEEEEEEEVRKIFPSSRHFAFDNDINTNTNNTNRE